MDAWRRVIGPCVAATVFVCAFGARGDPAPLPPPGARPAAAPNDPERLPIVSKIILVVKDSYFDSSRIAPRRMVTEALRAVAARYRPVVVEGDASDPRLILRVGSASHHVDLLDVGSIWKVRNALGPAVSFLLRELADDPDARNIEEPLAQGLLSTLDPRCAFIPAAEYGATRRPSGVGLVMQKRGGQALVVDVLPGTPAERVGLLSGDTLVSVAGHPTAGATLDQLVGWLTGEDGTEVDLVWRHAREQRREIVRRELIRLPFIRSPRLLPGGIGYVGLYVFRRGAAAELLAALGRLRADAGGSLRGLVLDLRGSPGGLLKEAADVADMFMATGPILETWGGGRALERVEAKAAEGDELAAPIVVLVNGQTAAGAEIVAAALREGRGALLAGERTFGLGTVDVIQDLGTGPGGTVALRITIATYRSPDGHALSEGLTPDLELRARPATPGETRQRYGEAEDDATAVAADVLRRASGKDRAALLAAAREVGERLRATPSDASGAGAAAPPPEPAAGVTPPRFAVSVQLLDGASGDGLASPGERVTLRVDVRNVGDGPAAADTAVTLSGSDPAYAPVGALAPGAEATVELPYALPAEAAGPARLDLSLRDTGGGVSPRFEVELPFAPAPTPMTGGAELLKVTGGEAVLRSGASTSAPPLATVPAGAVLRAIGTAGDFRVVEWTAGRRGFIEASAVALEAKGAGKGKRKASATPSRVWPLAQPRIVLDRPPTPAAGAATLTLSGRVLAEPGAPALPHDIVVVVGGRKVAYFGPARREDGGALPFSVELPHAPGVRTATLSTFNEGGTAFEETFTLLPPP